MPNSKSKVQLLYLTIIVLISSVVIWSIATKTIALKETSIALLPFLGTFLGAVFAFRLNENKEKAKALNEQLAALDRALFTLAMQKSAVISYRRKFQQFDTPTKLALAMPAMKPPRYENLRQDFEALNFLLALEKADLLIRLAVEDERFHQTFESIRLRSDYYHDVVFPELVRHKLAGKNVTDLLLESTLGERIWKSALFYAEEMQDHVNKSMESISHLLADLHSAAEAMFPEKKFTAYDFEAPPNSPVKRPDAR